MSKLFAKETELVAAFCACLTAPSPYDSRRSTVSGWTIYHETAGWDVLLVSDATGLQIGIEAKLSLNAKVLVQALPANRYGSDTGPDYRAALVPGDACQHHMRELAGHLGVTIITIARNEHRWLDNDPEWRISSTDFPQQGGRDWSDPGWFAWLPIQRENLPDYVPDVIGGDSAPVALTEWKIKAIKLMILLERRGIVHRSDMKALGISPTRWTDSYHGYLARTSNGYTRCDATPDLKAQHPTNWAQIEADFDAWNPYAEQGVVA